MANALTALEILDLIAENTPLYKDSGLWQFRTDDMEDVLCQQRVNETLEDFIYRYYDKFISDIHENPEPLG